MSKQWYVLHTYSGFENRVRESLQQRARAFDMGSRIGEVFVPTEDVVEIRGGKRVVTTKKFCPGYVLVELDLDLDDVADDRREETRNRIWQTVKETPKVTGFVGSGQIPLPLTDEEVARIRNQLTAAQDKPKMKHLFERGDSVRIVDGPFSNFNGVVEQVNPERSTVKVMVPIFGRDIPVELDFLQVEKTA